MLIKFRDLCNKYNFVPKGIIHVGAHDLEEQVDYREFGINQVIWVEGNPEIVEKNQWMVQGTEQVLLKGLIWEVDNVQLPFNVTNNLQSSSILEFGKHATYHPHVVVEKQMLLPSITLATLLEENNFEPGKYNFINLDIQGVELRALKGFEKYLDGIDYIYSEVNAGEVYVGNDSIQQMDEYLSKFGFVRKDTDITQYEWGDAFYIKEK